MFSNHSYLAAFVISVVFFLSACEQPEQELALKDAYENAFLIGTVLNRAQIFADDPAATEKIGRVDRRGYFFRQSLVSDPDGLELALHHFNALTPENVMKWEEIHPEPGVYDFDAADRFVDIAEANDMFITAHALVWHSQTPDWVYEDDEGNELDRDALLERMRDHIQTIVGRYQGRIHAWDVVNESLNEDGSMRESRWYQIIGEDYIQKAFEFAREADPDAELYYNDYNMEVPSKRDGTIRLVRNLQDAGAPITGIGTQSHFRLGSFPDLQEVENTITMFADLGIDVMVTELDINVLPQARNNEGELDEKTDIYRDGLPDDIQEELTQRYKDLFRIYLEHQELLKRVTFWGHMDADSWLNYLPMERVNHPLLFDRNLQPKPAFEAIKNLPGQ